MTQYYIWHKDEAPEELLAKHPNHAIYGENGNLFLFCESLEIVTGVPSDASDINSFIGSTADEDFMDEQADKATYTGTKQERIDARIAARVQARKDARIALRVAIRTAARVAERKEIRMNARQGRKLYDDWVDSLPVGGA